jgi:hypothetical protein
MGDQTVKCAIGFFAGTGIAELSDNSVFESGTCVADFDEAIDAAGS